jgi:hypothetical protein
MEVTTEGANFGIRSQPPSGGRRFLLKPGRNRDRSADSEPLESGPKVKSMTKNLLLAALLSTAAAVSFAQTPAKAVTPAGAAPAAVAAPAAEAKPAAKKKAAKKAKKTKAAAPAASK